MRGTNGSGPGSSIPTGRQVRSRISGAVGESSGDALVVLGSIITNSVQPLDDWATPRYATDRTAFLPGALRRAEESERGASSAKRTQLAQRGSLPKCWRDGQRESRRVVPELMDDSPHRLRAHADVSCERQVEDKN